MPKHLHACIFLATGFAATAGPVAAADTTNGPYGQVSGGGSHPREMDFGDSGGTVDFESGGLGAISLGYATLSGWRPEVELAFRRNDAEKSSGTQEAGTAMANLWYDFGAPGFAPRLRPYLGVGAGSADIEADQLVDASGTTRSVEDTVFAYQAGAGVSYDATRNLALSLGYRYLQTDTITFPGTPASGGLNPDPGTPAVDDHYRNDGVLAGLRYTFGRAERSPVASAPAPAAEPQAEVAAFETVVLRPVNFKLDRAELTAPSRQTLDELAARLKEHPEMQVTIEGHADATGAEQYNEALGRRRAESVRDYLVSRGVKSDSLQIASAGETQPVADNASTEGRAQNRRAEVATDEAGKRVKIVIEGPTAQSVDAAKEKK
jgi:OmpA-OmpF porin, OOP family